MYKLGLLSLHIGQIYSNRLVRAIKYICNTYNKIKLEYMN